MSANRGLTTTVVLILAAAFAASFFSTDSRLSGQYFHGRHYEPTDRGDCVSVPGPGPNKCAGPSTARQTVCTVQVSTGERGCTEIAIVPNKHGTFYAASGGYAGSDEQFIRVEPATKCRTDYECRS